MVFDRIVSRAVVYVGWLGSFGQISGWDKWTTLLS